MLEIPTIEVYDLENLTTSSVAPKLAADTVHVWQCALDRCSLDVGVLYGFLSDDELERSHRYAFERHRTQFVLRRGCLRFLLAAYVRARPEQLVFSYSSYGKPRLKNSELQDFRFNLSHSDNKAAFAFAKGREIGIDIERIRETSHWKDLAEHLFSAAEQALLAPLSGKRFYDAFYQCWTRKEAYTKALGPGLSISLHQFDVHLESEAPLLLAGINDVNTATSWVIYDLAIHPEYATAVVIEC